MLGLGLKLGGSLAYLPALSPLAIPPLPTGWAFVTLAGDHIVLRGDYLIAKVN